jgi:peroxiredoxin
LAIASDDLKLGRGVHDDNKLPFDVLCDVRLEAIRGYGLYHHEPFHDLDVSLPANILIDKSGRIVWMHIATKVQDRMDPDLVLRRVQTLTMP